MMTCAGRCGSPAALAAAASAQPPTRADHRPPRCVLVAAANRGGDDRPLLKYALTDAERFSQVMQALGGVDAGDVVMLKQPRVRRTGRRARRR